MMVGHQEQLHVLRYDVGQQYKDHWDVYAGVRDKIDFGNGRQRLATILMYLNDGGGRGDGLPHDTARWSETADRTGGNLGESRWSECASRAQRRIRKGDVLLFYDPDLYGDFDTAAARGCPACAGRRTATKWIHEMPFHNPKYMPPQCVDATDTAASVQGGQRRRVRRQPRVHGRGVAVEAASRAAAGTARRIAMIWKGGEEPRSAIVPDETKRGRERNKPERKVKGTARGNDIIRDESKDAARDVAHGITMHPLSTSTKDAPLPSLFTLGETALSPIAVTTPSPRGRGTCLSRVDV